ncbi:MAG: HdeD family acid-resistance protein [Oscillospiraceae bacterium]
MKEKTGFDWMELIVGILFILGGIFTFANPAGALASLVFVFSILLAVRGIADISRYFRVKKFWGTSITLSLIVGILDIVLGIFLLFNLGAGVVALSILFPVWFMIDCIINLAHLDLVKAYSKGLFWFTLIVNIIGIVIAVLMMAQPVTAAFTLAAFIALYLLVLGLESVVFAFSPFSRKDRP